MQGAGQTHTITAAGRFCREEKKAKGKDLEETQTHEQGNDLPPSQGRPADNSPSLRPALPQHKQIISEERRFYLAQTDYSFKSVFLCDITFNSNDTGGDKDLPGFRSL